MKLWQKSYVLQEDIEQFTVGQDRVLDLVLAPYDIAGSLAHIQMLESVGLLEKAECELLTEALRGLFAEALAGKFSIEDGVEDVHSQVELLLTRRIGEAGKKIHSGRSRNDQVLVDLRLFFRAEIEKVVVEAHALAKDLLVLAERHKDVLMPGYTHFQVAMVSSFGLWLSAYAESLADDLEHWLAVYNIVNQNPLGSAAGYGSSFPLNRRLTTQLLGFADLNYNVVHAQMGRGKTELFLAFALAGLAHTLGRLAMDVVLYLNQNFAFITFPEQLTTGSSIMPHKKNPDVFELLRGRCNLLQGLPAQVSQLTGNLPSGYHRDYQLLKEQLFPALSNVHECLYILRQTLPQMQVRTDILENDQYRYLYSVEEVNKLVLAGIPFRDAYHKIGQQIESGDFQPDKKLSHTHEGSIGNLCLPDIARKLDERLHRFDFETPGASLYKLVNGQ